MCWCPSINFSLFISLGYLNPNNIYLNINHHEVCRCNSTKQNKSVLVATYVLPNSNSRAAAKRSYYINSCNRWFQAQVSCVWGPNGPRWRCAEHLLICWCKVLLEEIWKSHMPKAHGMRFCIPTSLVFWVKPIQFYTFLWLHALHLH